MKRRREYVLYAPAPGGPFTTRTAAYPSWPYRYRVRATSIRQAYWLAGHNVFLTAERAVGICEIGQHDDFPFRTADGSAA